MSEPLWKPSLTAYLEKIPGISEETRARIVEEVVSSWESREVDTPDFLGKAIAFSQMQRKLEELSGESTELAARLALSGFPARLSPPKVKRTTMASVVQPRKLTIPRVLSWVVGEERQWEWILSWNPVRSLSRKMAKLNYPVNLPR